MSEEEIAAALRAGRAVADGSFDAHLPERVRAASRHFWTPVRVAASAARWLTRLGARRLLDVGSGAGKFCVVGALSCDLSFVGLEQRGDLVAAARGLARRFGLAPRVAFVHGVLGDVHFEDFDAFYLFNPFAENIFEDEDRLDGAVELSVTRFLHDVSYVERALARARVGTALVTYHGFGGRIPDMYDLVSSKAVGPSRLRLWVKRRSRGPGRHRIESEDASAFRLSHLCYDPGDEGPSTPPAAGPRPPGCVARRSDSTTP